MTNRLMILALTAIIAFTTGYYVRGLHGELSLQGSPYSKSVDVKGVKNKVEPEIESKMSNVCSMNWTIPSRDCSSLSFIFAYDKLDKIMEDLKNKDPKHRIKAIELLGIIGSPAAHVMLKEVIYDDAQDVDIKATAIKAVQWEEDPRTLMSIFDSADDPDIMTAVIEAADRTTYDPETRRIFDAFFFDAYQSINKAEVLVAILDYFVGKPEYLEALLTINRTNVSEGVLSHIQELREEI